MSLWIVLQLGAWMARGSWSVATRSLLAILAVIETLCVVWLLVALSGSACGGQAPKPKW